MKTPANILDLDAQLCFALYSSSLAMTKVYKPLLAELGLVVNQAGTGSTTYNLTAARGDTYGRVEVYRDIDWTADDYAARLAAIAGGSVLLGALVPLAPRSPCVRTPRLVPTAASSCCRFWCGLAALTTTRKENDVTADTGWNDLSVS